MFASSPYATVSYAEGSSFTLMRNGKLTTFKTDDAAVLGMEIMPGDIIKTASSTFIEIFIKPIGAAVQIAENTSFRCDADSTGTKSTGELYYGRVRAKVAKLASTSSYRISSPSLVAGVRGTDFGLDVIAVRQSGAAGTQPASSPELFRVFCFEGSVMVSSAVSTVSDTLMIEKNEMVEKIVPPGKENAPEVTAPLTKKPVTGEVVNFWKVHPFAVISALPLPVASAPSSHMEGNLTVTDRPWPAGRDESAASIHNTKLPYGSAVLLVGLGSICCAGAAVWSNHVDSAARFINPAFSAGGIMIGSGTVLALASLLAK